jgi:hypothetical protein
MIPNYLHIVEQVKLAHPQAWKDAHTGNVGTEDFVRLVAAEIHAKDARCGLNGKRGNPKDISDDALNFHDEGPDYDPTFGNQPVTVIDIIGAAGTPQAYPQWLVASDSNAPVAAAWVSPMAVNTPDPTPPALQPYPGDPVFDQIGDALFYDYALAAQPPNPGMGRWLGRTVYDYLAGMPIADSIKKHRAEWRAALGLSPL